MFRRVFLAAGLAAAFMPATGMAQGVPADISGQYRVEGRNADGSAYAGLVNVNQSGGGVGFAWVVGSQSYSGTGTREGRRCEGTVQVRVSGGTTTSMISEECAE